MPPKTGGTKNLRSEFEALRFQAGGDSAMGLAARERMAAREQRSQKWREQAADNLDFARKHYGKDSSSGRPASRASVITKCVLTLIVLVVGFISFFLATATRSSYATLRDSSCFFRRNIFPRNVGATELQWLDRSIRDAYQAGVVHSEEHNRTMFWGTYRPNVLAGVKSREAKPLLFGIAFWDGKKMFPVRHTAEDGEAVFFRWDVHDGRWYGREIIEDKQLGMRLRVRFAKSPSRDGWVLSVQSERHFFRPLSFALYFASEFEGSNLEVRSKMPGVSRTVPPGLTEGSFSLDSKLLVSGKLQSFNNRRFVATVEDRAGPSGQEAQWQVFALQSPRREEAWNIDFHSGLKGHTRLAEHDVAAKGGYSRERTTSLVLLKKVSGDFRFDVTLSEQPGVEDTFVYQDACTNEVVFSHLEQNFHQRFEETFRISNHFAALAGTWPQAFRGISAATFQSMCESGLSNLLGGMGYWHGDYRVQTKPGTIETHGPRSLFSGVPSRAKFPRGFLWDEGFHQLLVHHWDRALSEDVLLHWLSLMEPNGWIPREQILGPEARTRVPDQFVPQHPEHTNPPAMILVLQGMLLDRQQQEQQGGGFGGATTDDSFTEKVLPLLGKWFKFVTASQCGGNPKTCTDVALKLQEEAAKSEHDETDIQTLNSNRKKLEEANTTFLFRWRSRNGYHLLASGLDDYPRPFCRGNDELHVDLFSWAHMMSRALRELMAASASSRSGGSGKLLREFGQLPHLKVSDEAWRKWLVKLHWSKEHGHFSDSRGCAHVLSAVADDNTNTNNNNNNKQQRSAAEKYGKTNFSPFFGYVNLWPILTLSLEADDHEFILATLRKARDELSGGKGLQSLSNRSRHLLDKHDDYWTGPLWINVNFLFLRALHRKYIKIVGAEAIAIYDEVRRDVLANVARVFAETGKLWENYDWKTGNGRGTAPFTGWTTLVILIAAEQY